MYCCKLSFTCNERGILYTQTLGNVRSSWDTRQCPVVTTNCTFMNRHQSVVPLTYIRLVVLSMILYNHQSDVSWVFNTPYLKFCLEYEPPSVCCFFVIQTTHWLFKIWTVVPLTYRPPVVCLGYYTIINLMFYAF